jgi:hypothetical protein
MTLEGIFKRKKNSLVREMRVLDEKKQRTNARETGTLL